jgi:hypothetical protein
MVRRRSIVGLLAASQGGNGALRGSIQLIELGYV